VVVGAPSLIHLMHHRRHARTAGARKGLGEWLVRLFAGNPSYSVPSASPVQRKRRARSNGYRSVSELEPFGAALVPIIADSNLDIGAPPV
jgi:hypothetical protein